MTTEEKVLLNKAGILIEKFYGKESIEYQNHLENMNSLDKPINRKEQSRKVREILKIK